jgi:hypothetical protein
MMLGEEHAVLALVADRVPLDEIERYINELPLDHEHRSALWLLAWVHATNPATLSLSCVIADMPAAVE